MECITTKEDLLGKLRAYAEVPDSDIIRFKEKIKTKLLQCPELLYALNNKNLESELFDEDGNINAIYHEDNVLEPLGAWDEYFGYNIRPYTFIEQTYDSSDNYICYTVSFNQSPKYNQNEYYAHIIFTIMCDSSPEQVIDSETGIARHDLIASILRENFAWTNIFGTQCILVSDQEKTSDKRFIIRQMIFELTKLNAIQRTPYNGNTEIINHLVRR